MTPPDDKDAYEVGYKKPPKHTRFQSGRSGNPKGRPKTALNLRTILDQEFNAIVVVTENGRRRTLRKGELMIKSTINRAIKGDPRAVTTIVGLLQAHGFGVEALPPDSGTLDAYDAEMLQLFLEQMKTGGAADVR